MGFVLDLGRALHSAGHSAQHLKDSLGAVSVRLPLPNHQFFRTPTSTMASFRPLGRQRTHMLESLHEVHDMSADNGGELTRILAAHREHVAAARAAAQQRALNVESVRHECEAPLRRVAIPLLREWSARLGTEGYPASVEDRLGCRPPSVVFRLAPHGLPAASLTLACEAGPAVRFKMNVDGKDLGDDLQTPLIELETGVLVEQLGRFVTAALAATIPRRSDCG